MTSPSNLPKKPPEEKREEPIKPQSPRSADHIVSYAKNHSREFITYVLMLLGILLLLVNQFYGGILVGIVAGIHFSDEIINYIIHWRENLHTEGVARHLTFSGLILAFFISAPAIFLGAAVAVAIKHLFVERKKPTV